MSIITRIELAKRDAMQYRNLRPRAIYLGRKEYDELSSDPASLARVEINVGYPPIIDGMEIFRVSAESHFDFGFGA